MSHGQITIVTELIRLTFKLTPFGVFEINIRIKTSSRFKVYSLREDFRVYTSLTTNIF